MWRSGHSHIYYSISIFISEILIESRILCIADVVEAMYSHRPYCLALGLDKALEEIRKNKGIFYDPKVANICLKLFSEKGFKFE